MARVCTVFCILSVYFINLSVCTDTEILGCGGFVKSDVKIDFSQIEIQLFTSEGMVKYQTECAPNNGYFMVPFVEKGNFVLKIDPPKGWLFEPMSVVLNVDGVNDDCTKGKDINFMFKGFTVSGQVSSFGSVNSGPEGITVELKPSKSDLATQSVVSVSNGSFKFEGVLPGEYIVSAAHKNHAFDKKTTTVIVTNGNMKCKDDLIVSGYDITGKVSAQSLPITGVQLLLFTKNKVAKEISGCSKTKPESANHVTCPGYPVFVCTATSSGEYVFRTLPPGEYAIVPFHKGERTQYDIEPPITKLIVSNDHVNTGTGFTVTGYSVQGRVLTNEEGDPVEGAKILINGMQHDVTNSNGYYTVKHKHTDSDSQQGSLLKVVVVKEDLKFLHAKIKVGPDTPFLPNIVPDAFALCGRVEVAEPPSDTFSPTEISVEVTPLSNKDEKTETIHLDKNSRFCFMKKPGDYRLKTIISKSLEDDGLVILPALIKATVKSKPVKDVYFAQYRATFTVRVMCIDACKDVTVELTSEQTHKKKQKVQISEDTKNATVQFSDLLPGDYVVHTFHADWCWTSETEKITLPRKHIEGTTELANFKQSGFVLVCSISHDIEMIIYHAGEKVDTFSLKKGRNRLCLSQLGEYTLEPRSCHRFDIQPPLVYNTARPKPITLHAVAHEAVIAMETSKTYLASPLKEDKIPVELRSSRGKVTKDYLTLYLRNIPDKEDVVLYRASYWANDGEKLDIIPSSKLLLFDPPIFTATMQASGCSTELAKFKGIVGTFITGQVTPSLSNVHITIETVGSEEEPLTLRTGKSGDYKVGPLHPEHEYKISASLDDYVMTPVVGKPGHFEAKKLSKLTFKIQLAGGETPLPGVLLSISGGDYRSNNLTGNDGSLTLTKLEPGQYYFKAIMKEYQFEPPSQVIDIIEGARTEIKIIGKRVAYSVYGSVTSLNGEPEVGVFVRALALPGSEHCTNLGEEGNTGNDGLFRVLGLHPGCKYNISVRNLDGKFSRVVPEKLVIEVEKEDLHNVKFVAFRPLTGFELSGRVITPAEYLPHIKMVLYRAGDSSTPVHTVSLTKLTPFFYLPTLTRDEKEYVLKLECSLSPSVYEYTAPAAGFFAVGPHKHITLTFDPQLKALEQDMPQVSILSLPITLLVILLAYNYSWVLGIIRQAYQFISARRDASDRSARKSRK